jgi:5'-phosphate synthase pdxT subunit
MRIGVLALQGDYEAHRKAVERAGATAVEVRTAKELESTDALILPGGESTTMLKLLELEGLMAPLQEYGGRKPMFGTCAGAILLAKEVQSPAQASLGLIDITIERNGYGRQIDSRIVKLEPETGVGLEDGFEAVFIRAPIIRRTGKDVRVLARYAGDAVLIEEGRHLVATFHPELTADPRMHELFIEKVKQG